MRLARTVGAGLAAALLASTAAQATELSTTDRVNDRREVTAGTSPGVVPALREWSAGSGASGLARLRGRRGHLLAG